MVAKGELCTLVDIFMFLMRSRNGQIKARKC
jgi:hypothetical protein